MVEYSPKILANEEKATTTNMEATNYSKFVFDVCMYTFVLNMCFD